MGRGEKGAKDKINRWEIQRVKGSERKQNQGKRGKTGSWEEAKKEKELGRKKKEEERVHTKLLLLLLWIHILQI